MIGRWAEAAPTLHVLNIGEWTRRGSLGWKIYSDDGMIAPEFASLGKASLMIAMSELYELRSWLGQGRQEYL